MEMVDARKFVDEVKEWVGNDPIKAAAFGVVCGLVGYLLNIWPL